VEGPGARPAAAGMTDLTVPVGPGDHVRGPQDAAVTVVEYADVECPYCRRLEPVLRRLIEQRDDVRLVYRHFPLVREHPHAYSAALALEAAAEHGRFWQLHDVLFAEGSRLGRRGLAEHAERLGLDPAEVLRPASERFDAAVREDFASGTASGVEGTPGLFVDGLRFRRSMTLQQLSDAVQRAAAR
jgi:NhaA family Na+:H+ antiporter